MESEALSLACEVARPFESLHLSAYWDPVGFPTIGYGRLLSREKWAPLERWADVTEDEAEAMLQDDMAKALRAVGRLCPGIAAVPERAAAIADFTFNLGSGYLELSTLRRVINRGEHYRVPGELGRWVYAGGTRLAGLVRRRRAEADLYAVGRL